MNNNVICYFEPLPLSHRTFSQESYRFLEIWKKSWEQNGWSPKILDKEYAITHPEYNKLKIGDITNHLYKDEPHYYTISCYNRIMAYCKFVLDYGPVLYADYDVINYGFGVDHPFLQDTNTVIGSGTSLALIDEIGANDIINAIKYRVENYDESLTNLMHVFLKLTKKFKYNHKISNDILRAYDGCKESEFVHYHGGWVHLPDENKLGCKSRVEFAEKFRDLNYKG